ncbi:unnamed protein product [Nyctereutes procyonoides]|uniref:(raccoon dog) hypothetical protein n=1 Tax=Nyctereutes procyonoides TaxID=34880 RepID=A0A811YTI0_NYCPR|nr:unnamed protein product [Nyctereutes procyonoides]
MVTAPGRANPCCRAQAYIYMSKVMLELKVLESSGLTEVLVYGSYLYKLRAKWMLQSMDAMKALQLGPWMK